MVKKRKKKVSDDNATPAEELPAKKPKLSDASAVSSEVPLAKVQEYATLDARKIFIGGVPKTSDESAVRKHFAKCGEIAELSFPRNKRGLAMGIAFVTYKKAASATKSLELHSTNFAGNEISVKLQDNRPKSAKTKTSAEEGGESTSTKRKRKMRKKEKKQHMGGNKESVPKTAKAKESVKLEGKAGEKQKKNNKRRRDDEKFNAKLQASEAGDGSKKKKKKVKNDES